MEEIWDREPVFEPLNNGYQPGSVCRRFELEASARTSWRGSVELKLVNGSPFLPFGGLHPEASNGESLIKSETRNGLFMAFIRPMKPHVQ